MNQQGIDPLHEQYLADLQSGSRSPSSPAPAPRRAASPKDIVEPRHRVFRLPLGWRLVQGTGLLGRHSLLLTDGKSYASIEVQRLSFLTTWTFSFTRLKKAGRGSRRSGTGRK